RSQIDNDSATLTKVYLVAHHPFPIRAAVTTPVERWLRFSLASPTASAFLLIMASWLPRGHLEAARRSRALQPAWTTGPLTGPFLRVLQAIRCLLTRSECLRLEREFAVPDFDRGDSSAFSRHTQQCF